MNGARASVATAPVSATPSRPRPSRPTNLAIGVGDAQLTLTWTAPAGATGTASTAAACSSARRGTASFTDTGLTNGTAYSYRVAAVKQNSAESAKTAAVSSTPVAATPAVPTGLAATPGSGTMSLTWTAVSGATAYRVYRGGVLVGSPVDQRVHRHRPHERHELLVDGRRGQAELAGVRAVRLGHLDPGRHRAVGTHGSRRDAGRRPGRADVDRSVGCHAYRVYRDGDAARRRPRPRRTPTYRGQRRRPQLLRQGVPAELGRVAGVAAPSARPPVAAAPSAPTGLAAAPGDTQVSLSWTAVSGATAYRVYRDGALVGSPASTSYTDTGLVNGVPHSWTVTAVKRNSRSRRRRRPVNATPVAAAAGAPTNLVGTPATRSRR